MYTIALSMSSLLTESGSAESDTGGQVRQEVQVTCPSSRDRTTLKQRLKTCCKSRAGNASLCSVAFHFMYQVFWQLMVIKLPSN